jgi:CheY-like chemotaxis protein
MMVQSDQLRIKQVLTNLFSNAIKYTKDDGKVSIVCQYVVGSKYSRPVVDRASI